MNLPNKLTILRIVLIPFFIATFYMPWEHWNIAAAVLFIAAFITDMLDGYLARKNNMVTNFGKFMDPIADKILTIAAMVMLLEKGMFPSLALIVVVAREFLVSGLRMVVATGGQVIAASWLGKAKTISQFVAICFVLLENPLFSMWGVPMDTILIWLSTGLTLWSGIDYVVAGRNYINPLI